MSILCFWRWDTIGVICNLHSSQIDIGHEDFSDFCRPLPALFVVTCAISFQVDTNGQVGSALFSSRVLGWQMLSCMAPRPFSISWILSPLYHWKTSRKPFTISENSWYLKAVTELTISIAGTGENTFLCQLDTGWHRGMILIFFSFLPQQVVSFPQHMLNMWKAYE